MKHWSLSAGIVLTIAGAVAVALDIHPHTGAILAALGILAAAWSLTRRRV
ncbi:MAG: hypothetical protein GX090_07195 [Firmicutes bacterium]|nr:hypothetical protein [Bacillota bacterium]HOB34748.1 hypothetical protein [Bacillota bacterium]HPZ90504.1 hypothetical protein [Bacillota bacterium]HQE02307.1 hypothetical protein [Bacillota bacterium]